MRFVADLHVHSRYSRATSRDADLAGYHRWARTKGIDVVGTGDFTHPRWYEELSSRLMEKDGLFVLRDAPRDSALPGAEPAGATVRFMLTTEISSIYRKRGQVRKVHSLLCVPTLDDVRKLTVKLAAIGNIASDGRPILGLDPKDLLSILLQCSPEGFMIPAHVWTPWFSLFGSRSGFDSIEDCFEELTPHIFALETGLSSDPPMNWRWSALDRFRLVSNSDAHSPGKLGREANLFDTEPSWTGIKEALRTGDGFLGTFEFYPEEGKYHFDGHRKCGVCMSPEETRASGGICPACRKPLTIGVLNRVLGLADRTAPAQPRPSEGYRYIIPLPELLAEAAGAGTGSQAVAALHARVVAAFGSEFAFLLDADVEDIARSVGSLLAEAVRRMREGKVDPHPGYDGEFGVIRLFDDAELARLRGQEDLFPGTARGRKRREPGPSPLQARPAKPEAPLFPSAPPALDSDQQSIVDAAGARSVVFAGPGTGKTRLLAAWIARVAGTARADGTGILALTFTNRAAAELKERLSFLPPGAAPRVLAATFHSFCWSILREHDASLATIFTPPYRAEILHEMYPDKPAAAVRKLSDLMERSWEGMDEPDAELGEVRAAYEKEIGRWGGADLSSLVSRLLQSLQESPSLRAELGERFGAIAIDELQDINRPQYELLRILCAPAHSVLGIGDPDQAIYGFRGSDRELFYSFREETGARSFSLSRNYRSTPPIVDAAEALIAGGRTPGIPPLTAQRAGGDRVHVAAVADPDEEGRFIAARIRDLVGGVDSVSVDGARSRLPGDYAFSDIAVLFRTRAVRDALLPALGAASLPVRAAANTPFAEEEPFRSLIAAVRLLVHPEDSVSLRILRAHAAATGRADAVDRFLARRAELARKAAAEGIPAVFDEILADVVSFDRSVPAVAVGEESLRAAAAEHGGDPAGFLARAALCARESEGPRAAQKIALLTFHAAKGLEFPVVFIAGAEEGITPLPDDPAEERRLFYVAATRARDLLVITHCAKRRVHGETRSAAPSRFLDDIPRHCRADEKARPRPRDVQLTLFG